MQCIIYVRDNLDISIYDQFNECARLAKRYAYSVKSKTLDFTGNEFYKAIDMAVFDKEVDALIVYKADNIGDHETALFYRIYLEKFGKKLVSCN